MSVPSFIPTLIPALISALVLALAPKAHAQPVQRCEDASGRPTYTNGPCPAGSRATRTVDTAPPVQDADAKSARERARRDLERADALKRDEARAESQARAANERQQRADAAQAERCERARRDRARARENRDELGRTRTAKPEQIRKADRTLSQREEDLARLCPR